MAAYPENHIDPIRRGANQTGGAGDLWYKLDEGFTAYIPRDTRVWHDRPRPNMRETTKNCMARHESYDDYDLDTIIRFHDRL